MTETLPQENLRRVLEDFDNDLKFLLSQQVLSKLDVKKIRSQAEVSKNAMLSARDEPSFNEHARNKLINALIRDFEKSIQRTLDEAVGRKGDKALLVYRLKKVDKKIALKLTDLNITSADLRSLQFGMDLLKSYIFRSLPEKGGIWSAPKIDVGRLVKNYEQSILDEMQNNIIKTNFLR